MLDLGNVTLCAVASRDPEPAIHALRQSMRGIRFGAVKLLTARSVDTVADGIERIEIREFPDIHDYSMFMLYEFGTFIDTDFVLVVQWDGFVAEPAAWQHEFLEYDYLGAPWPQFNDGMTVGNGGFSLRSRKLLEALEDPDLIPVHPEDVAICRVNRVMLETRHGVRFAPPDVAARFSFERQPPTGRPFGFHGIFNFPNLFPEMSRSYFAALPAHMLRSRDAFDLCARLVLAPGGDRGLGARLLMRMTGDFLRRRQGVSFARRVFGAMRRWLRERDAAGRGDGDRATCIQNGGGRE